MMDTNDVDQFVDHYVVLGLPSGEKGAGLPTQEIHKAYRSKAKVLHPDKRLRDDPDAAHADFLKLRNSYQVLKDEETRKIFDHHLLLRVKKRDQKEFRLRRQGRRQQAADDSNRRRRKKMVSDLEERGGRSVSAAVEKARAEEEGKAYRMKLKEEISRLIQDLHTNKMSSTPYFEQVDTTTAARPQKHAVFSTTAWKNCESDEIGPNLMSNLVGAGYHQAFEDSVLEKLKKPAQGQNFS